MAALRAQDAPANALWLDTLDLGNVTQDFGNPHAGKSVDVNPMTLDGIVYPHGLGTHAVSRLLINLKGAATKFEAMAGVDDEKKNSPASVQFQVFVDGKKKTETPSPARRRRARSDLRGLDRREADDSGRHATAGDGIDSDHADWAGALLTLAPGAADKPVTMADVVADEPPMPIFMGGDSPVPAIHGPRIMGATPGHPFLFLIPATGDGPLTYGAKNLPAGLTLDKTTGIISGALKSAGTHQSQTDGARAAAARQTRTLTIVGGDHPLALTPPLGWNSWNVWAGTVDAGKVRDAADQFIAAGLAAHGYPVCQH